MKVTNIKNMIVGRSETVASLQGDLETLNAEGAGLIADVETHERVIETAEAEGEILTAMGKVKAARNRLAKLDKKIAETRERLAVAQDAERARELAMLRADFFRAGQDFLTAATACREAADRATAARVALGDAGFHVQQTHLPPIPSVGPAPLLAIDLLDMFRENMDLAQNGPQAPAKPAAPRLAPVESAPVQHPTPARAAPPAKKRVATRAPHREEPRDGECLMVMMRAGIEYGRSDLGQSMPGDIVSADATTAKGWLLSGAADFHKADDLFPTPPEEVAATAPAGEA